ncbi:hypothetical protein [Pleionea sediminis]|uniref:hypothetical protein n=1 Tax=Pleionea sediminis TaxID=2569479 RepID=UPI00118488A4|nr:hypothetical protein [Pleionea sediminis]
MKRYLLLSFILLAHIFWEAKADVLYVFVPSSVRATAIQNDIQKACPDITVTVFGRGKDFRKQVEEGSPDAILSLIPVIEHSNSYNTIMRGQHNGNMEEDYVLVSIDQALDLNSLKDKKIGVVDLLGRKPMGQFVSQLFQADVKIKRVTKPEDLLPLLTFRSADAIFISERTYQDIKSKSNLNLVATRLNIKVGLAGTALNKKAAKDKFIDCVKKFDESLNATLGVDKWQSL